MRRLLVVILLLVVVVLAAMPAWLPFLGTELAFDEPIEVADVALVLEGTGQDAIQSAEAWRQTDVVHDVVIVEAPVKTHALVAYWSDFVRWGVAAPSPTPADHLQIVRATSTKPSQQALAALPALQEYGAHLVLVPGGGGIGSRLVERELLAILEPAGIGVRLVGRDVNHLPADWFRYGPDRRAVLDGWLKVLVPYISGYDEAASS